MNKYINKNTGDFRSRCNRNMVTRRQDVEALAVIPIRKKFNTEPSSVSDINKVKSAQNYSVILKTRQQSFTLITLKDHNNFICFEQ